MTLYLLNYANYYNRIVAKLDTVDEYEENAKQVITLINANFNPNDGISTTHTFNYSTSENISPDYMLAVSPDNDIVSRWYVIEAKRTAGGQYSLTLYRDVIADWYDEVVAAPTFIEKATVSLGDTAIFNNENMGYNQIKTSETLLKDQIGIPWIVGYVSRTYAGGNISVPASTLNVNYEYNTLDEYTYHSYDATNPYIPSDGIANRNFKFNFYTWHGLGNTTYTVVINNNKQIVRPHFYGLAANSYSCITNPPSLRGYHFDYENWEPYYAIEEIGEKIYTAAQNINWASFTNSQLGITTQDKTSTTLLAEEGKIIQTDTGYYKIHVHKKENSWNDGTISENSSVGLVMKNIVGNIGRVNINTFSLPVFEYEIESESYWFSFESITIDSFNITLSGVDRPHLDDAPYDMFAIPYGKADFNIGTAMVSRKDVAMRVAAAISKELGDNLYDIQLLPFAPFEPQYIQYLWEINPETVDVIEKNEVPVSFLMWLTSSSFTRYLNYTIPVPITNEEFKVANECDFYRLTSPNYNGTFEFSSTKNNGVSGFRADCRYKPFQPYIRIAPIFNGLYGTIQDDARGLICGGDFSLTQIRNAWQQYEIQNKNYQAMFDRQIENLEFNNNLARIQETWNIATGTVSGVAGGAVAGAMTGIPFGGVAGAVIGGGASLAGGIADLHFNEKARQEAMDYTIDNFGYQLGNIKALPNSLAKVSSFNPNNKIFPVLEYYTCTDIEKEALRNKIKYNGMTIMRIGTIQQFQQTEPTYIKGKIIRLTDIADDYHVAETIASEIYKGVFI